MSKLSIYLNVIIQNNTFVCNRWLCSYLSHSKAALPAGHDLVPLVMQRVHEAVRLVLTNKLRDVGGERRVLREANAIACRWTQTQIADSVAIIPLVTTAKSFSPPLQSFTGLQLCTGIRKITAEPERRECWHRALIRKHRCHSKNKAGT